MGLTSLQIIGVFERQDIFFNFEERPFFLVGPNGTGKSTALKILHAVLTAQWRKLIEYPFHGIEIMVDGEVLSFERSEFVKIDRMKMALSRRLHRRRRNSNLLPSDWSGFLKNVNSPDSRTRASSMGPRLLSEFEINYTSLAKLNNYVESFTKGNVLYFPTYRRVERDLKDLLEEDELIDEEWDGSLAVAPAIASRFESSGEVVGFGGQDIQQLIVEAAARIQNEARQALNEHSVRFLQTISTDKKVDLQAAKALIKSKVRTERLFAQIANFAPTTVDLSSTKGSVENLAVKLAGGGRGRLGQREDTFLAYLSELVKLFDRVEQFSYPLHKFSELITKYLKPIKKAELNNAGTTIIITDLNGSVIEPNQLSSGEKQILAFFAFLLLRGSLDKKFIIIDEPELSLSVSWQKTLISDILSLSPSAYVVSATHSPFIFSAFGLQSVFSLGEL